MSSTVFDRVIVGSSPLAIMYAVKFARAGLKTVIVEKNKSLGGAWRSCTVEELGEIESSCHLIEFYSGAYETISDLIELDFTYVQPQPIKIFSNGKSVSYTTRASIIKEFLKLCIILFCLIFIRYINCLLPSRFKVHKGSQLSIQDMKERVWVSAKYRLIRIFEYKGIKAPIDGYVTFSKKLREIIKKYHIHLIHAKVESVLETSEGYCKLVLSSSLKKAILSKEVYITESTILENSVNGFLLMSQESYSLKTYWHIVASIDKEFMGSMNSYIHLPDSQYFHRITTSHKYSYFDNKNLRHFFIVQMRRDPSSISQLQTKIETLFRFCHILSAPTEVKIHKTLSEEFITKSSKKHNNNKKRAQGPIHIIETFGDLGKSIALNYKDITEP